MSNSNETDNINEIKNIETSTSESVESLDNTEDEKIDVTFGDQEDSDEDVLENVEEDLSKYTVVDADHLDEDAPIKGQEYCLLSFMSPEGIMNCNVRAVKFRGAFPTLKKAQDYAAKIEKNDKYFKIYGGETGKWLDFDPPASKVERELSSNKEHQKILDAQAKQQMNKINELAGKTKQVIDKMDKGKKTKIEESKKAGAAEDAVDKQRAKMNNKEMNSKTDEKQKHRATGGRNLNAIKERMRKKLAEKQNKNKMDRMKGNDITAGQIEDTSSLEDLDMKVKVVSKVSEELQLKKDKLETAGKNIDNIRKLLANKKSKQNNN